MNAYRLARGVRLQRKPDGASVLLVPEGIVELNASAASALALLDGTRDAPAIARILGESYEADPSELASDVRALLDDFAGRGFVTT